MRIKIEFRGDRTLIVFNGGDVTDDLTGIVSAMAAGRYCFEAGVLLSSEFAEYIALVKQYPNDQFGIEISNTDESCVFWGRFKEGVVQSIAGEPPPKTLAEILAEFDNLSPEDKQAMAEVFEAIEESRKVYCSECQKRLS